jgi:GntR family transcriptional regulator
VIWAYRGVPSVADVTVDHDAPIPAYEQLASVLRARIASGEWASGPLPSVKALQDAYGVGRDTVLRAVEALRADGLVFTVPRRGTYVTPQAQAPEGR